MIFLYLKEITKKMQIRHEVKIWFFPLRSKRYLIMFLKRREDWIIIYGLCKSFARRCYGQALVCVTDREASHLLSFCYVFLHLLSAVRHYWVHSLICCTSIPLTRFDALHLEESHFVRLICKTNQLVILLLLIQI